MSRRADSQSLLAIHPHTGLRDLRFHNSRVHLAWTQAQSRTPSLLSENGINGRASSAIDFDQELSIDQEKVELVFFRWCAK